MLVECLASMLIEQGEGINWPNLNIIMSPGYKEGFPCGSDGKESTCDAEDQGSIPGSGRSSGGGNGNPLQYSYLENSLDQGSLVGYSPCGRKESDVTTIFSGCREAQGERLNFGWWSAQNTPLPAPIH